MIRRIPRIFIVAWVLFWVLMMTVQLQDYINSGRRQYWQPVLWESSSAFILSMLWLTQRSLMFPYDYLLEHPRRWFTLQMAWLPLYWILFTPLVYGLRHGVYALLDAHYSHGPWLQVFFNEAVKITLFFVIFVVILFGILSYQALLREKQQALLAEQLMRETQLHRLTQQIQPHFLFNALNTVSQLMHVDIEKADATLIQLADLLRATLNMSEQHETSLATELQLARAYAHLMGERFAERVEIIWEIDPRTHACMVPVMSLQPLLENIFKHTVEQRRHKTHINIVSTCNDGQLLLRLDDDLGTLMPGDGTGIGLRNLRARLQTLYGDQASLTLVQLTPAGVRAEMSVPCVC